jgi:hypothetical protein
MARTIKYTGSQDRWSELAVTGKQSTWSKGQTESREDAEAGTLLATGLFSAAADVERVTTASVMQAFQAASAQERAEFRAAVAGDGNYTIGTPCSTTGATNEVVLATIKIPKENLTKNSRLLIHHSWLSRAAGTANRLCIQLNEADANPGEVRIFRIDASTSDQQYSGLSQVQFQNSLFSQVSGQAYSSNGLGATGTATPLLSQFDFLNNDLTLSFTGETLVASNSVTLLGASVQIINGA